MIKLTVKLGRDRSRDVAMVTNLSLFISHNFFRNSDQRVINIVHLATMRSIAVARIGVIHEVDRRRVLLNHANAPTTCQFLAVQSTGLRWDTTISASAALNADAPSN